MTQERVREKDLLIENGYRKISELKQQISKLQNDIIKTRTNTDADTSSVEATTKDKLDKLKNFDEMSEVLVNYKEFIQKISIDYDAIQKKTEAGESNLGNMESKFSEMLHKYEALKHILKGYEQNQAQLLSRCHVCQNIVSAFQKKCKNFKKYTNHMLNKANKHLENIQKNHRSRVAEIQVEFLKTENKISQLERTISNLKNNSQLDNDKTDFTTESIFTPLETNLLQ